MGVRERHEWSDAPCEAGKKERRIYRALVRVCSKRSPNDQNRTGDQLISEDTANSINHYSRTLYQLSYARSRTPTPHKYKHIHAQPHTTQTTHHTQQHKHKQPIPNTYKPKLQKLHTNTQHTSTQQHKTTTNLTNNYTLNHTILSPTHAPNTTTPQSHWSAGIPSHAYSANKAMHMPHSSARGLDTKLT